MPLISPRSTVFLFLILLLLLATPAGATTVTKTYTQGALGDYNLSGGQFYFYNTDYKSVRNVTISGLCPQVNCRFLSSTSSTTFDIIFGGSGTGTVTYRNETDLGGYDPADGNIYYRITWLFTNANLVGNRVNVSYNTQILNTVVARRGGAVSSADVSANIPAIFFRESDGINNFSFAGDYTTVVDTQIPPTITSWSNSKTNNATLSFNIDPQESVLFTAVANMNIDRWEWYLDGVNLNNNFSAITKSFSAGTHNLSTSAFNGTGGTSDPKTWTVIAGDVGTLVEGNGNSPSGQIYFDYSVGNVGNKYGINISMTSANFSDYSKYYIDTYDPTRNEVSGFPVEFGSQTYSTGRLYLFDRSGTYFSNLSYCSFWNFACPSILSPTLIDTAVMVINPVSYSYNITTDKTNYTLGQNIIITATNPSLATAYVMSWYDNQPTSYIAYDIPVPANSVKAINATISPKLPLGEYFVSISAGRTGTQMKAMAVFNITTTTPNLNVLDIAWVNKYGNALGSTGFLNYVSNYNQTDVTIYRQNLDQSIQPVKTFVAMPNETGSATVQFDKTGEWYASIQDKNTSSKLKWSNITVLATDPTDDTTQKQCTSTESYACWDKHQYTQGDAYVVNYKVVVPPIITYYPTVQFVDPDGNVKRSVTLNYSIYSNTITGQVSGSFSKSAKTGVWFVRIEKINQLSGSDDGEITNSATEVIGTNQTTTDGATIPTGSGAVSSVGDNLKTIMSQMFFWGLILLSAFALIVYRGSIVGDQHKGLSVLAFAFLETIGGLFAPYTVTVFIVLVLIIAIGFKKAQETTG